MHAALSSPRSGTCPGFRGRGACEALMRKRERREQPGFRCFLGVVACEYRLVWVPKMFLPLAHRRTTGLKGSEPFVAWNSWIYHLKGLL